MNPDSRGEKEIRNCLFPGGKGSQEKPAYRQKGPNIRFEAHESIRIAQN
jgi:hypothetical protein